MTQFSTLNTQFTDGEILKTALRELGFTLKTDAEVRGYKRQRVNADIVVVLKGKYDLGFYKDSDETFILVTNLWGVSQNYKLTDLIYSIMQKYKSVCERQS